MTLRAEIWLLGYSETSVMSDLTLNICKTSQVTVNHLFCDYLFSRFCLRGQFCGDLFSRISKNDRIIFTIYLVLANKTVVILLLASQFEIDFLIK